MRTDPATALGALVVLLVIFLVCRELICWYWKINRMVVALQEIAATTKRHLEIYESERAQHD
jgi:hypothetical protein